MRKDLLLSLIANVLFALSLITIYFGQAVVGEGVAIAICMALVISGITATLCAVVEHNR